MLSEVEPVDRIGQFDFPVIRVHAHDRNRIAIVGDLHVFGSGFAAPGTEPYEGPARRTHPRERGAGPVKLDRDVLGDGFFFDAPEPIEFEVERKRGPRDGEPGRDPNAPRGEACSDPRADDAPEGPPAFPDNRQDSIDPGVRPGGNRHPARHKLTLFDESGVAVACTDPRLAELLRNHRWRELFVAHRAELIAGLRVVVFGHATYEALLSPFRGLTAKCVLTEVAPGWLRQPLAEQLDEIDGWLAADLAAGLHGNPRALQPLPLLGLPGVVPENEDPAYYDDTWQFRPGRRAG